MTVGNINSAPQQDYKVTAQAGEETKTLQDLIKAAIEEKEKADAKDKNRDRVEISDEGKAKAAQPSTAAPEEADKKPGAEDGEKEDGDKKSESEDEKKKKPDVSKTIGDDSRWQAEIAKIKQKRTQLLQQVSSANDEKERKKLEAKLAMTEAELVAKDTDAYRKSRTTFRDLGSQAAEAEDAEKLS